MSQACGNLEYISGGTINGASIINSQITDSVISNSVLSSCEIKNLTSIDAASLQTIINGLVALPPNVLAPLADALFAAMTVNPGNEPAQTAQSELSVVILGGRGHLLGQPQMFAKLGQYLIPLYREGM